MSVHTRMHRTKSDCCTHPTTDNEEKSTHWREVFKEEIERCTEVGAFLSGARLKAEMTQKQLAEKLGAKTHHISEMEHGKRPIGKKMAHKLASVLGFDYKMFL